MAKADALKTSFYTVPMQKILLITGASRGIGAATAILAAARGYAVCINYRQNAEAAEKVLQQINSQGGKAIAVQADISQEPEVLELFKTVDKGLGPLTALVNNAAYTEKQSRLEAMDSVRLSKVFATNITASFLCAREAVKRMSTKHGGQGGSIVNVSSLAAQLGGPGEYVDYAAAKGAIDTMTIGLAKEVADERIRVNGVRPGLIYTEFHAGGGDPTRVDRLKETIPMKRGGQPIEIANAILWLLSDEASYCTGAILNVSGGR
jgi:NAD(P)-dependent dehydrogenase (short-subunit alcohol dehydrogenase family)